VEAEMKPKFTRMIDGIPCMTVAEHEEILEEIIRMIRAEIDHAILNDTQLPPRWNQIVGDYAVRVKNLEDVIHAIRGEENEH
jgi:hypothetical protein